VCVIIRFISFFLILLADLPFAANAGGPFTGFSPLNPALTFAGSLVYDCAWRVMWMYLLAQATGGRRSSNA
jgi:hypothetical protein